MRSGESTGRRGQKGPRTEENTPVYRQRFEWDRLGLPGPTPSEETKRGPGTRRGRGSSQGGPNRGPCACSRPLQVGVRPSSRIDRGAWN